MIRKELDPFSSDDKFARSGRHAEEQMAFYLKRFFESDKNTHVLNSVRLERDGDAAQVDHLILHPYGAIIVESKSVQGKVQIKDDGQWIRWYGDRQSKGMASPVTQAQLQAAFLRTTLARAAPKASDFFATLPIDTYIAISDAGVILWPKSGALPEVCKADQVPQKVMNCVNSLAQSYNNTPLLTPENTEKLIHFLITSHRPLIRREQPIAEAVAVAVTEIPTKKPEVSNAGNASSWTCRSCGSRDLLVQFAHNYFLHCKACEKNTPIKPPSCSTCGEPERVRKQNLDFHFDCKKCGSSRRFYTNA